MGAGLLSVKSGFILFIKDYQFSLEINTLEREREREILSNLRFGSLEIRDTLVTRVTNNYL